MSENTPANYLHYIKYFLSNIGPLMETQTWLVDDLGLELPPWASRDIHARGAQQKSRRSNKVQESVRRMRLQKDWNKPRIHLLDGGLEPPSGPIPPPRAIDTANFGRNANQSETTVADPGKGERFDSGCSRRRTTRESGGPFASTPKQQATIQTSNQTSQPSTSSAPLKTLIDPRKASRNIRQQDPRIPGLSLTSVKSENKAVVISVPSMVKGGVKSALGDPQPPIRPSFKDALPEYIPLITNTPNKSRTISRTPMSGIVQTVSRQAFSSFKSNSSCIIPPVKPELPARPSTPAKPLTPAIRNSSTPVFSTSNSELLPGFGSPHSPESLHDVGQNGPNSPVGDMHEDDMDTSEPKKVSDQEKTVCAKAPVPPPPIPTALLVPPPSTALHTPPPPPTTALHVPPLSIPNITPDILKSLNIDDLKKTLQRAKGAPMVSSIPRTPIRLPVIPTTPFQSHGRDNSNEAETTAVILDEFEKTVIKIRKETEKVCNSLSSVAEEMKKIDQKMEKWRKMQAMIITEREAVEKLDTRRTKLIRALSAKQCSQLHTLNCLSNTKTAESCVTNEINPLSNNSTSNDFDHVQEIETSPPKSKNNQENESRNNQENEATSTASGVTSDTNGIKRRRAGPKSVIEGRKKARIESDQNIKNNNIESLTDNLLPLIRVKKEKPDIKSGS